MLQARLICLLRQRDSWQWVSAYLLRKRPLSQRSNSCETLSCPQSYLQVPESDIQTSSNCTSKHCAGPLEQGLNPVYLFSLAMGCVRQLRLKPLTPSHGGSKCLDLSSRCCILTDAWSIYCGGQTFHFSPELVGSNTGNLMASTPDLILTSQILRQRAEVSRNSQRLLMSF